MTKLITTNVMLSDRKESNDNGMKSETVTLTITMVSSGNTSVYNNNVVVTEALKQLNSIELEQDKKEFNPPPPPPPLSRSLKEGGNPPKPKDYK